MDGILAIDPAGPIFEDNTLQLSKNDAMAVQALHTNCPCDLPNFLPDLFSGVTLGHKDNVGSVDFYLNGGRVQPGCGQFELTCHHSFGTGFLTDLNKRNTGSTYRNE